MRVHCKDCKFWEGPPDAQDFHSGSCHIDPPQFLTMMTPQGPQSVAAFVSTKGDTWCGKGEKMQPLLKKEVAN